MLSCVQRGKRTSHVKDYTLVDIITQLHIGLGLLSDYNDRHKAVHEICCCSCCVIV